GAPVEERARLLDPVSLGPVAMGQTASADLVGGICRACRPRRAVRYERHGASPCCERRPKAPNSPAEGPPQSPGRSQKAPAFRTRRGLNFVRQPLSVQLIAPAGQLPA